MSTNFYYIPVNKAPCPCCNRPYDNEMIHIGKRSGGWNFTWCGLKYKNVKDWSAALRVGGIIVDEYGREHAVEEFLTEVISLDSERPPCYEDDQWYDDEGHRFSGYDFS